MEKDQFLKYIEDYNTGDLECVRSHYTDDIIFENYGDYHVGEDTFEFIGGLMEMLHTTIIPEIVLIDGDRIALFGEMRLIALRDQVNPALGAMTKNDRKTAKLFVFYDTVGLKISHIRIAGWPGLDLPD